MSTALSGETLATCDSMSRHQGSIGKPLIDIARALWELRYTHTLFRKELRGFSPHRPSVYVLDSGVRLLKFNICSSVKLENPVGQVTFFSPGRHGPGLSSETRIIWRAEF